MKTQKFQTSDFRFFSTGLLQDAESFLPLARFFTGADGRVTTDGISFQKFHLHQL